MPPSSGWSSPSPPWRRRESTPSRAWATRTSIQATEDQLRSYPATEVIFVTGPPEADEAGEHAVSDLRGRLRVPLRRVIDSGTGAG